MKIFCVIMILFGIVSIGYGMGTAPKWFVCIGVGAIVEFQGIRLLLDEVSKPDPKPKQDPPAADKPNPKLP